MKEDDWRDNALCAQVDPELFFPTPGATAALPKSICEKCDVRTECLDAALTEESQSGDMVPHGVRGGLSAMERAMILRDRRAQLPSMPGRIYSSELISTVARMQADGETNLSIAATLGVAERTVQRIARAGRMHEEHHAGKAGAA